MDGNAGGMLMQVGLMNKVSTGSTFVDIALCMLLPMLLAHFAPYLEKIKAWLQTGRSNARYSREIVHTRKEGWYFSSSEEPPNNLLQQAILLFIGSKPELIQQYSSAQLDLVKKGKQKKASKKCGSEDDSSDDDSADYYSHNTSRQLKSFKVNTVPPDNVWVTVQPGVDFMRVENVQDLEGGKRQNVSVHFHLQSNCADGQHRIASFVDAAYSYYQAQMTKDNEKMRYLYTPTDGPTGGGGDEAAAKTGIVYKRYELSEEKTFASLFHPDKESILRLVDHFVKKEGKYAIPGYGHKLGLLLHGPPGTGKTSLIKALAQYTERSIISIPLSQIKTNQELMDIVFDQSFPVGGEELPSKLPFSKTVFVMEDVDAACSVVARRSSSRGTADFAADTDIDQSGEVEGPVQGPALPREKLKGLMGLCDHPDKLNLAGLLNVLDGVVDCPNRIVVMTTNHPEKLDPALIRPGRVNKKVYMGYMRRAEAEQMRAHYFPGVRLADEQQAAFVSSFVEGVMSPAELEMLCADADDIEGLNAALAERSSGQL